MSRDTAVASYLDDTMVLGRDLGPTINIRPTMTRKILKANGQVVYRSTVRALTLPMKWQTRPLYMQEMDKVSQDCAQSWVSSFEGCSHIYHCHHSPFINWNRLPFHLSAFIRIGIWCWYIFWCGSVVVINTKSHSSKTRYIFIVQSCRNWHTNFIHCLPKQ